MGGVRTALYNYLYAKQKGGDFILRIEDTDSNRFVPGAEEYIIESLRWCGICPDEGVDETGRVVDTPSERHPHAPYRQSMRRGIYRSYAEQLVASGNAYYAFDTPEALDQERAAAEAQGRTFIYNHLTRGRLRNSLTLPPEEVARLLEERSDWTIRFRMPEGRIVEMDDLIRGHIEVDSSTLDDKVLWKRADELPTYHLANIVDDHLMEITEVIRGEEWLPSLPLHYLLYEAFGWEESRPRFAHLPLLLKPVGNGKLSKRDGDKLGFPVFPLRWTSPTGEVSRGYREDGYFPEAFVNLLAMLGWNPGTEQELFSLKELVEAFSLDKVGKSGSKFNPDKAKWFNREYLRMKSDTELTTLFLPILKEKGLEPAPSYVEGVVGLIKERATFVQDFWTIASYLFVAPTEFVPKDVDKFYKPDIYAMALEALEASDADTLEAYVRDHGMPMGKVMNCLRLALSGAASGLGISDILHFIGKAEGLRRLRYLKEKLG
jgi:glutamyl-tRNA synthetase